MSENDQQKRAFLFGSAGMAASGMTSKTTKKEPTPESYGILNKAPKDIEEEEAESATAERAEVPADENPVMESGASPDLEVSGKELPVEVEHSEQTLEKAELGEDPGDQITEEAAEDLPLLPMILKAAVLSHVGEDSSGNTHEMVFHNLSGVETVAISDDDPSRLMRARTMMGANNAYDDYRELLDKEDLDIVAVSSTDSGLRFEMVKAALERGLHVICGARFTRTLREAHELLALATAKGVQLAVVNPISCDPHLISLASRLPDVIGDLLEIRAYGKMGETAGGEDLLLNAPQLFDLIHLFAGEVTWCAANVTKNGERALRDDIYEKEDNRDLGPLLGDRIQAHFETESGVSASFVSSGRWSKVAGQYGIELIGAKSILKIHPGNPPALSLWKNPEPQMPAREDEWILWPADETHGQHSEEGLLGEAAGIRRVVRDLLSNIHTSTELHCSAKRATSSLEMVHAVWQAGITGKRAYLPLVNRLHPLSTESL